MMEEITQQLKSVIFKAFVENDFVGKDVNVVSKILSRNAEASTIVSPELLQNYCDCGDLLVIHEREIYLNSNFPELSNYFCEKVFHKLSSSTKEYSNSHIQCDLNLRCFPKLEKRRRQEIYALVCKDRRFAVSDFKSGHQTLTLNLSVPPPDINICELVPPLNSDAVTAAADDVGTTGGNVVDVLTINEESSDDLTISLSTSMETAKEKEKGNEELSPSPTSMQTTTNATAFDPKALSLSLRKASNRKKKRNQTRQSFPLANKLNASEYFKECGLLGYATTTDVDEDDIDDEEEEDVDDEIYLNVHEPFCLVTVGVQGSGKSHTVGCVLESCLLPFPTTITTIAADNTNTKEINVINLHTPMTALVLHYDQNVNSLCETIGLTSLHDPPYPPNIIPSCCNSISKDKVIILVSPSYYYQRKEFYGDEYEVIPLLFTWSRLTADHIKRMMNVSEQSSEHNTPLYISLMLDVLRNYQRNRHLPTFAKFQKDIRKACKLPAQKDALNERLKLLSSFIRDDRDTTAATTNVNDEIQCRGCDLESFCGKDILELQRKHLIIVDLTDPLLARSEVNDIFQVLVEQFKAMQHLSAKILVLDEAHKYMSSNDGLNKAIVSCVRLMRHDGMRLIVSTQSPLTLASELLELVSVTVMHQFHSPEWFRYLSTKLALPIKNGGEKMMQRIMQLQCGEALIFVTKHLLIDKKYRLQLVKKRDNDKDDDEEDFCSNVFPITIRPRLTADHGQSKKNNIVY